VTIRELRPEDVRSVVDLHEQLFPEYFLTHLGATFLELFYAQFTGRGPDFGFIGEVAGSPVGFVVGTVDPLNVYRAFYRRHLLRLALIVAARVLTDRQVRSLLAPRLRHVAMAASSVLRRSPSRAAPQAGSLPAARLLSIGVLADHRGQGVAEALAARFCARCAEAGVERVGLSVQTENGRAIAFYERTGWQRGGASRTGIEFVRQVAP
jgi:ribosomal protein S18 acetylase RimI-like enzyme